MTTVEAEKLIEEATKYTEQLVCPVPAGRFILRLISVIRTSEEARVKAESERDAAKGGSHLSWSGFNIAGDSKSIDEVTRLTRERSELANTAHLRFKEIIDLSVKVALARAQGAEEMREAAAKCIEDKHTHNLGAGHPMALSDSAAIRALPLPSPVAARAVPSAAAESSAEMINATQTTP